MNKVGKKIKPRKHKRNPHLSKKADYVGWTPLGGAAYAFQDALLDAGVAVRIESMKDGRYEIYVPKGRGKLARKILVKMHFGRLLRLP